MQRVQGHIPDWGAKILYASQPKNQNRNNIVTNSKKTLKMVRIKKRKKKKRILGYKRKGES